ncbi:hypothetical protein DFH06DRAFT_191546 [Mycena polygramma]|nr:hypothetical protein DFH06DRAFT_191546 [Mycena polygramma]
MSIRPSPHIAALPAEHCDDHPLTSASASTLRNQLAEIDGRIACLEAQLELLHSERRVASDALNSAVYPVLNIPPELTTQILECYIHGGRALEENCGLIRTLLTAASVCRAWRTITVSCGALWNRISMSFVGDDADRKLKLLQMCLSRSGNLPLHLDLSIMPSAQSYSDAFLSLLRVEWLRCKTLRLWMISPLLWPLEPTPFPSLTKVDITSYDDEPAQGTPIATLLDAPLLREARLTMMSLSQISLPWGQLADLHLSRQTLPQCFEILGQTPNLEMLSILHPTPSQNTIVATPHILRHLHRLECSDVFLNHLTLPILNTLALLSMSSETSTQVKALVDRSGCTLRVLRLNANADDVDATYHCIKSLPSIQVLSLELFAWNWSDFEEFFTHMADDENLPELRSLNLVVSGRCIDVRSLAYMLHARWTDKSDTAKLTSFSLLFDSQEVADLGKPVAGLLEMRRQGLGIDIRSAQKWTSQSFDSQMIPAIMN